MSLSFLSSEYKKLISDLDFIISLQDKIKIDDEPSEIINKKSSLNKHLNELINNSNKLNKQLTSLSSSIVERNQSHNYILNDVIRMFKLQEKI